MVAWDDKQEHRDAEYSATAHPKHVFSPSGQMQYIGEQQQQRSWMETLHLTCATDIAPLKSDGAKIFWHMFSLENLPILELVADLI